MNDDYDNAATDREILRRLHGHGRLVGYYSPPMIGTLVIVYDDGTTFTYAYDATDDDAPETLDGLQADVAAHLNTLGVRSVHVFLESER